MPARTNDFQKFVFDLKRALAVDAQVEESAMLVDLVTGDRREVDVLISSSTAGHAFRIGIECRDHKRPQTVEWVESMYSKHQRLPTNVLVLASSSGFTAAARRAAQSYGIELVEVGQDDSAVIQAVVGRRQSIGVSWRNQRFETVQFSFALPDGVDPASKIEVDQANLHLFDASGVQIGELGPALSERSRAEPDATSTRRDAFGNLIEELRFDNWTVNVASRKVPVHIAVLVNGRPAFLRVKRTIARVASDSMYVTVPLVSGKLGQASFAQGKSKAGDPPVSVLVTDQGNGIALISASLPDSISNPGGSLASRREGDERA